MRRVLPVAATVLSLALCGLTIVMWVRSVAATEWVSVVGGGTVEGGTPRLFGSMRRHVEGGTRRVFASKRGQLVYTRFRPWFGSSSPLTYYREDWLDPTASGPLTLWDTPVYFRLFGFEYARGDFTDVSWRGSRAPFRSIAVPHWFVVLLTAALPVRAGARAVRRLRRPRPAFVPRAATTSARRPTGAPSAGHSPSRNAPPHRRTPARSRLAVFRGGGPKGGFAAGTPSSPFRPARASRRGPRTPRTGLAATRRSMAERRRHGAERRRP